MGLCSSTSGTSSLRSTKRTRESPISDVSLAKQQSVHIVSIHILDDDSLLNIFYLYRPYFLGEDENTIDRLGGGMEPWIQGHWWYQLAHVCQRWRNLILGSASYLRLSLICTNGTPVANMLAHSPPLPLTVNYRSHGENVITTEDEKGILLALEHHDRLLHVRLFLPFLRLRKLVMAINGEFPILESLVAEPSTRSSTDLMLPESLQAPHLRHLMLKGFAYPIRSRFHPTAASLVTLSLKIDHQSAYFQPNILLQWISFMPQLVDLQIHFSSSVPNRDMERQLTRTPFTAHITLPRLCSFRFRGVSAYMDAVVRQIVAPHLKNIDIILFKELTYSIPCLLQFMNTIDNLWFNSVTIKFFNKRACVETYGHRADAVAFKFNIRVHCWDRNWSVSSAAQILNALSEVFSVAEHLSLQYKVHNQSSEEHNHTNRMDWRNLLRPFSNVKTLRIEDGLVEKLSRCLQLEDGELPLELLPELQELKYFGSRDAGDVFTSFVDARLSAGRPVIVDRRTPGLIPVSLIDGRPRRWAVYLNDIEI